MNSAQIPLRIGLRPASTFSTFIAGTNAEAADYLARLERGSVYLWGPAGSGKTHLLQAACHRVASAGRRACYLPLAHAHTDLAPAMLEGLDELALVCIDDVHRVVGDAAWEYALFALFNSLRDAGGALALCADRSPRALGFGLADLASRLSWGPVFQLHPLGDDALAQALQLRAQGLGLEMLDE
ncbi:MAG: DnaA regulatory inactivator Hda, partial [Chromatiales bacterium]|nr:DnaA regulatory inactivator Hda [Chromatiales bacterium]